MLFTGEDEISGVDNLEHGDDEEEPNEGVSQAYLWSHLVPMFVSVFNFDVLASHAFSSRCGQGEEKGWVENCSDLRDGERGMVFKVCYGMEQKFERG